MDRLQQAIALRTQKDYQQALDILHQLLTEAPSAEVHYHCAWTHDNLGQEREAIPHYEQALALGLAGEERLGAMVGLGSSYRCTGQYEQAAAVFTAAMEQFPTDDALPVFMAMTQYNLHNHADAMRLLLEVLAKTSASEQIQRYQRALLFYSDKLDDTW